MAAAKGWRKPVDSRSITPDLQSRLDATAANPGSAQPTFGQTPTQGGGLLNRPTRGNYQAMPRAGAVAASAAPSLGQSFVPGGRIVS